MHSSAVDVGYVDRCVCKADCGVRARFRPATSAKKRGGERGRSGIPRSLRGKVSWPCEGGEKEKKVIKQCSANASALSRVAPVLVDAQACGGGTSAHTHRGGAPIEIRLLSARGVVSRLSPHPCHQPQAHPPTAVILSMAEVDTASNGLGLGADFR